MNSGLVQKLEHLDCYFNVIFHYEHPLINRALLKDKSCYVDNTKRLPIHCRGSIVSHSLLQSSHMLKMFTCALAGQIAFRSKACFPF